MPRFGVPWPKSTTYYAAQGGAHHRVVRECPICGKKVPDRCDNDGEIETNNYGEHCEQEHPGA